MTHYILFTGHMIDAADRRNPRFPPSIEELVKQKIYNQLVMQKVKQKDTLQGIAGGACGGDILFHESCGALNISSQMYLGMPPMEFKKDSVSFAGEDWNERFDKLANKISIKVLPESRINDTANIYELTNEWMLETALAAGGPHMTLIALWDGGGGDGKGGTQHMVTLAKEKGAEVEIIDITKI